MNMLFYTKNGGEMIMYSHHFDIISIVVHALIYGVVFRLLHYLSWPELILLGVAVLGFVWWSNRRYRQ